MSHKASFYRGLCAFRAFTATPFCRHLIVPGIAPLRIHREGTDVKSLPGRGSARTSEEEKKMKRNRIIRTLTALLAASILTACMVSAGAEDATKDDGSLRIEEGTLLQMCEYSDPRDPGY